MKLGWAIAVLLAACACGGGAAPKPAALPTTRTASDPPETTPASAVRAAKAPTVLDFELDTVTASSPSGPANPAPMPIFGGGSGLRSTVRGSLAKVAFCYSKALQANPKLTGLVTLHFTIGPDGTVTQASADGDGDAAMHDCMATIARQFVFVPEASRTVIVNYPFQLSGP